mmetsp:Transcript_15247/g.32906  ORF Transcript_15247/g.32906 Transcript_15247/m.32906 type:complete len:330 (-) Transcript_15247:7-996(-)
MGRKKIGIVSQAQEAIELPPFCYYCDKEFDSVKTLVTHQRAKHFNCGECGQKFDTITGLRVHMLNAYKKTMKEVPNAAPGRDNPDIVVHGMEGLPKGIVEERSAKARAERSEKERQHREKEAQERLKRQAEDPSPDDDAPEAKRQAIVAPAAATPSLPSMPAPRSQAFAAAAAAPPPPPPPAPASPQAVAGVVTAPVAPAQPLMQFSMPPLSRPMPSSPQHQGLPPPPPTSGVSSMPSEALLPGFDKASPSVKQLLSGKRPATFPQTVPGLFGQAVPNDLSALHPVALQALASVGAFPHRQTAVQSSMPFGGSGTFATTMMRPPTAIYR